MLTSALSANTIKKISIEAVADAHRLHADAPDYSRDFLVADDACDIAGRRMFDATLSALGVDGMVMPFGFWEDAARPHVAAVLGAALRRPASVEA